MPKLKTNVKGVDRSVVDQFRPYDGPEPTPGIYTAVLQTAPKVSVSKNGNDMITSICKLKANKADNPTKAQFDGYAVWDRTTIGDSEFLKARLANWLDALAGDDGADVDYNPIAPEGDGKVTKIGRKNVDALVGKKEFRVILKQGTDQNGNPRIECDGILPWEPATGVSGTVKQNAAAAKAAEAQQDEPEEDEEYEADPDDADEADAEEEWDRSARLAELNAASLKDIKELAAEYGIEAKGPKAKLVTAILDAEEAGEVEEDEGDAEQEAIDAEDSLREELEGLPLAKLKARGKQYGLTGPKAKLIAGIIDAELTAVDGSDVEEGDEGLTAESPIESIIAAIAGVEGYSAEDFDGYGEDEREELVEIAEEEGLFTAAADDEPF